MIYLFKGIAKEFRLGRILLEFGASQSDLRSTVVGYICMSYAIRHRDFSQALEWARRP